MPPFHPCGLVMDNVRFAVVTKMRFYRDDPRTTTVRWYYTEPGTPRHPYAGAFRSRVFWKVDQVNWAFGDYFPSVLGEQYHAVRIRTDGRRPALLPAVTPGPPCGSEALWLDGASDPVTNPPLEMGLGGWPVCCGGVPMPPPPPPAPCGEPLFFDYVPEPDQGVVCDGLAGRWIMCPTLFTGEYVSLPRVVEGVSYLSKFTGNVAGEGVVALRITSELGPIPGWINWVDLKPIGVVLPYPLAMVPFSSFICGVQPPVDVRRYLPFFVLTDENLVPLATEGGDVLTTEGEFLPPWQ